MVHPVKLTLLVVGVRLFDERAVDQGQDAALLRTNVDTSLAFVFLGWGGGGKKTKQNSTSGFFIAEVELCSP